MLHASRERIRGVSHLFPLMKTGQKSQKALEPEVENDLAKTEVFNQRPAQQCVKIAPIGITAIRELFDQHSSDREKRGINEAENNQRNIKCRQRQMDREGERHHKISYKFNPGA